MPKWNFPPAEGIKRQFSLTSDSFRPDTRGGGTYSGRITKQQLDGIITTIECREIHEFHFVTNGRFGPKARDSISAANDRNGLDRTAIFWHEAVWPEES